MRASLAIALVLPVVITGCPALLSDWALSGSGAVDASVDAAGPKAAGGGFDSGGGGGGVSSGSSDGSSSGGSAASSGGSASDGSADGSVGALGSSGGASSGGSLDSGGGVAAVCESLQGPTALGLTNAGATGVTFHSKVKATLVKFVFHNGGYADTVALEDGVSCSVIASIPIPANTQAYTANVSWPLVANKVYRLVSSLVGEYNETQAAVAVGSWPWTNGHNLVVDDCAGGADHCSSDASSRACYWSHQYWFNFTDLETCESGVATGAGGTTSTGGSSPGSGGTTTCRPAGGNCTTNPQCCSHSCDQVNYRCN